MFHFTRTILKNACRIIYSYFSWMNKYAKHPEKADLKIRYKKLHKLLYKISKGLQVDFYIEGEEHILNQEALYVCNHMSAFDPLAILSIFDKPISVVAKKEAKTMPIIGKCLQCIDGMFMDRKDLKQSIGIINKVSDDLSNGTKSWLIFPEGTRRKDLQHHILDFHSGTFKAAINAGAPIVPIAIYGTTRVLKLKPQYHRYPVHIKFLKPYTKEDYQNLNSDQLAELIQNDIERAVVYDLRIKDHEKMLKMRKYRFNACY